MRAIKLSINRPIFAFLLAAITLLAASPLRAEVPVGSSQYSFTGWAGPDLNIHTYRPVAASADAPIMIVMHGANRDPARYRDEWVPVADALGLIIAAPEFDKARFAKSAKYNLGSMAQDGWPNPVSAFSAIEPLFDDLKVRLGSAQERYYIYGHSAGAQFVHRFLFANPDARVKMAFAANAGWYTMLSRGVEFPYGLKGSDFPGSPHKTALSAPLVVLLGDRDTDRGGQLRTTPEADAQGFNRLQRGLLFFSHAATSAAQQDTKFAWRLSIVPGAGHSNGKMAWGVKDYIPASPQHAVITTKMAE